MIIAANFKANLTRVQTQEYFNALDTKLTSIDSKEDVYVFPAISSVSARKPEQFSQGVQNAYPTKNGAFSGEIGSLHLEEFGIKVVLIGHSERRHILHETQESLVEKFNYYKDLGYTIVYCVGEPLSYRKSSHEKMMAYIDTQYEGIDTDYKNLIIAYEPVWAIGTGLVPTNEEILSMHTALKEKSNASLLYGGSVKITNVEEILKIKNVDGVLVGGAALNVDDFYTMIQIAQEINKG